MVFEVDQHEAAVPSNRSWLEALGSGRAVEVEDNQKIWRLSIRHEYE